MEKIDHIVIGAGVIGLAIARCLAKGGLEVLILEKEAQFGSVTSARNSEVIHAGLYYPKDSLKARFCVEGRDLLYRFCQAYGIPHAKIGKVIVASEDTQLASLEKITQKARANGVDDLVFIDRDQMRHHYRGLQAVGGLFSPSSGIIDSHNFMQTLLGQAENYGAIYCPSTWVERVTPKKSGQKPGFILTLANSQETFQLQAHGVINAAGLGAHDIANTIEGLPTHARPALHLCKGNYFTLSGKAPFSTLVYPVPEAAGLGVHMTLDLAGQARFGPDTEWVESENYDVDPLRKDQMIKAIAAYWPAIHAHRLSPSYAGLRPKLKAEGAGDSDFRIDTAQTHGMTGLVNLFGVESPGLTASLAIADYVSRAHLAYS